MIVLVKANVLTVGLIGRGRALRKLPIRVVQIRDSRTVASSLKNQNIDSIISRWDLPDARGGKLLKAVKLAKPNLPIIAVVEPKNFAQEIAARSIGTAAVISSDVSDEFFRKIISEILGLDDAPETANIYTNTGRMR